MLTMEPAALAVILAAVAALVANGASALSRKGYSAGEVTVAALVLGPFLVLAPALSDKRPACPQCKDRNPVEQRCCGNCGLRLRA